MSKSAQVELVEEWGKGFQKKDLDILAKPLHKDFRHVTYPKSVGRPEQTREEWLKQLAEIIPLWTETKETTHSIIEAPGKVIVHFTNVTKTSLGIETTYEAITIAHVVTDEDGSLKIKKIEEFIDSKTFLESMQAFAAAKAK